MKVVLSRDAQSDLLRIGDFIAQDNPVRADSFVEELIGKAMELGEFPRRFPELPRFGGKGVRHRAHGRYVILYRIEDSRVLVMRVIHGAQDDEAWLEQGA